MADSLESVPTSLVLAQADLLWADLGKLGESLANDEMFWEPVSGCWSIRRQPDGSMRSDWSPAPPYPPFTTIAWRLDHIGRSLTAHAKRLFDQGTFAHATHEPAEDAEGMMRFVETSFELWRKGIAASGDLMTEALALEVVQLNGHHFRHLAEIQTVRDLYRANRPLDPGPFVDACLRGDGDRLVALRDESPSSVAKLIDDHKDLVLAATLMGRWHLLGLLLEMGFPVEEGTGASSLHYASAFGPLEVVRLLVEHGADVTRLDGQWNTTPLGWAEYFGRADVAEYLRSAMAGDD